MGDRGIIDWTIHKGHIRKRGLGFAERYKATCKKWAKRQREKRRMKKNK